MNRFYFLLAGIMLLVVPWFAVADDLAEIRHQIETLQKDYEQRIRALEQRLEKAEAAAADAHQQAEAAEAAASEIVMAPAISSVQEKENTFNPAVTVVLQGSLNSYSRDPDDYTLPGFQLGGEAGLAAEGLTLDETELMISASVDQLFFGQTTIALHDDGDETEIEVEEAYIDALAMPAGTGLRFGRFYSDVGYLNRVHTHAWDFRDAPLVYRAMLGKQYADDGIQFSWLAPTDLYFRVGGETLRGDHFPAGEATDTLGNSQSLYIKFGGDVGSSHSWQAGLSQLWVDAVDRDSGGHAHGGAESTHDSFSGDSNLMIADFVWKWAPQGNPSYHNLKFQTELFYRDEDGRDEFSEEGDTAVLDYDGTQKGLYAQLVYQFRPQWRIGARYDWLSADNDLRVIDAGGLDPDEVLEESALNADGHDPYRWSLMLTGRRVSSVVCDCSTTMTSLVHLWITSGPYSTS
jgi:hypothetical protein